MGPAGRGLCDCRHAKMDHQNFARAACSGEKERFMATALRLRPQLRAIHWMRKTIRRVTLAFSP
jgi:hypothetical protein